MTYSVYILHSKTLDKFYVGSTSLNVEIRLKKYHLAKHSGFTSKAKDWVIVWTDSFDNVSEARQLEMKIKKRGAKRYLDNIQ